jgi:hypothetical protein
MVTDRCAVGRFELDPLREIIVGILTAERAREHDLAHRFLLRTTARTRNSGYRDRDIGVAVRQGAGCHRPRRRERHFAKGFEDLAADIELRLFACPE